MGNPDMYPIGDGDGWPIREYTLTVNAVVEPGTKPPSLTEVIERVNDVLFGETGPIEVDLSIDVGNTWEVVGAGPKS